MTSTAQAGRTPAHVARMATQNDVLNRGGTDLIGLFGPKTGLTALVREAGGRIRRIKAGDRLSLGRVLAIDETGVIINRNGQNRRLTLPSG